MNLKRGSTARRLLAIGILVGIFVLRWIDRGDPSGSPNVGTTGSTVEAPSSGSDQSRSRQSGSSAIDKAFKEKKSRVWLEGTGEVERLLADDLEGDRHQRFIVRVSPQRTVLVSHNIDLADRIRLDTGDEVAFRGRYEWNERGGVVHWTHHDPRAGRDNLSRGGWIEANGVRVR